VPKLPSNISKAIEAWKEVSTTAGLPASLVIGGDDRLVALAQERFSVGGVLPAVWSRPPAEMTTVARDPGEVLILFATPEGEAEALTALGRAAGGGHAVLAVDEGAGATGGTTYPGPGCVRLSFSDTPTGWRRLFELCVAGAGGNVVALGRRYPALRQAAAWRVIYRSAGQNALIGAAFFVPGADMPAMTLNQAKMVLSLAGMYGQELGRDRAVELAAVVGMGFGARALARSLVRSTPGIGWVVKAGTGFAATVALGLAAAKYYEKGAPASTSRVVALAGSLRR
jgi:uncharacterized protein (DUF697 family)